MHHMPLRHCALLASLTLLVTAFAEVSDDTDSVQMLQRSTQVGEYYRMAAPKVYDKQKGLPSHYMGTRHCFCNHCVFLSVLCC